MNKAQHLGVQCLALQPGKRALARAVHVISQQRMSQTAHMHANLVGSSGFQPALNIGVLSEALQHPVMRYRILPVFVVHCHFFPVHRMAADGGVYNAFLLFDPSMDDG